MESLIDYTNRLAAENWLWSRTGIEIAPAPVTKPSPVITPAPSQDDPFNVPAPKINPTPKGFL
jgi:hypothetical protein